MTADEGAESGEVATGDDVYGEEDGEAAEEVTGFRLHAASIRFPHPETGEEVTVRAPPPDWWPRHLASVYI